MSNDSNKERNEKTLMRRIAAGILGWITYEKISHPGKRIEEKTLYSPIQDIAQGRKLDVKQERKIKSTDKTLGRNKSIDFHFYKKYGIDRYTFNSILEVTFISKANSNHYFKKIKEDYQKIIYLNQCDLDGFAAANSGNSISKYIMICGKNKNIDRILSYKPQSQDKFYSKLLSIKSSNRYIYCASYTHDIEEKELYTVYMIDIKFFK